MKIGKYFILLLIAFLIIFNWQQISWVFNYRTVSNLFVGFFEDNKEEKQVQKNTLSTLEQVQENILSIPKIDIETPLILEKNPEKVDQSLDKGAVVFPDSVLPGKKGTTIILGHSSPPNWPKVKYDWIFSRINELTKQDEVLLRFDNQEFVYQIKGKIFLEKGEEVPNLTNYENNTILLISCWPPGKDFRRIAVWGVEK